MHATVMPPEQNTILVLAGSSMLATCRQLRPTAVSRTADKDGNGELPGQQ